HLQKQQHILSTSGFYHPASRAAGSLGRAELFSKSDFTRVLSSLHGITVPFQPFAEQTARRFQMPGDMTFDK
ncbi:hypothetical protein LSTR_LSTR010527, partial [Laodelphax striatellus]